MSDTLHRLRTLREKRAERLRRALAAARLALAERRAELARASQALQAERDAFRRWQDERFTALTNHPLRAAALERFHAERAWRQARLHDLQRAEQAAHQAVARAAEALRAAQRRWQDAQRGLEKLRDVQGDLDRHAECAREREAERRAEEAALQQWGLGRRA